jgi:biopolymer transport protein ExbD
MKLRRRLTPAQEMEITPLIDVVFLLLIFFMLTSRLVAPTGLRVRIPQVSQPTTLQDVSVTVTIASDDRIFIDGTEVTPEELKQRLKLCAQRKTKVAIRGDSRSSLGRMIQVYDICQQTGVDLTGIYAQRRVHPR